MGIVGGFTQLCQRLAHLSCGRRPLSVLMAVRLCGVAGPAAVQMCNLSIDSFGDDLSALLERL